MFTPACLCHGKKMLNSCPMFKGTSGKWKERQDDVTKRQSLLFLITSHFTSLLIYFFLVRVHALSVTFSFWIFSASVQADAGDGAHRAGCVTRVPSEFHNGETVQGGILENIMA